MPLIALRYSVGEVSSLFDWVWFGIGIWNFVAVELGCLPGSCYSLFRLR